MVYPYLAKTVPALEAFWLASAYHSFNHTSQLYDSLGLWFTGCTRVARARSFSFDRRSARGPCATRKPLAAIAANIRGSVITTTLRNGYSRAEDAYIRIC